MFSTKEEIRPLECLVIHPKLLLVFSTKEGIEKRVFVPMLPPSLNEFRGRHWSVYHRIKRGWMSALGYRIGRGVYRQEEEKGVGYIRRVDITVYRDRFLDEDNFIGGCKPIPDVLKGLGWIRDDSRKWFRCEYRQEKVGGLGEGTLVEVFSQ